MLAVLALGKLFAVGLVGLRILTGWLSGTLEQTFVVDLLNLLFDGYWAVVEPMIATTLKAVDLCAILSFFSNISRRLPGGCFRILWTVESQLGRPAKWCCVIP